MLNVDVLQRGQFRQQFTVQSKVIWKYESQVAFKVNFTKNQLLHVNSSQRNSIEGDM